MSALIALHRTDSSAAGGAIWSGAVVFGVGLAVATAVGSVLFPAWYSYLSHAILRQRNGEIASRSLAVIGGNALIVGLIGVFGGGVVGALTAGSDGSLPFWYVGWLSTFPMTFGRASPSTSVGRDSQTGR